MWHNLDEQKRKLVAIALAIVVLYIAYRFSFIHAIEAYKLNSKLTKEASLQQGDAAYPHLNKKHIFYQKVLASYEVKKADVETKLWQTVSNMAVSHQVKISYNPSQAPVDTAANQKIFIQQFGFKGSYFSLVRLLDTLSKTEQVGRVSKFSLASPKDLATGKVNGMLDLQLDLIAIEK